MKGMDKMEMNPEFRIVGISTLQFASFEELFNPEDTQLRFEVSFSYGVDSDTNFFMCGLTVTFFQKEIPIIKINTRGEFEFKPDSFKQFVKNDIFEMPTDIVQYFTSILYGATRGILVCKLENTGLSGVILPMTRLSNTITHPLRIDLKENPE